MADRRRRPVAAVETDRRSGRDRRVADRRVVLPPLSRLVPVLVVVAVSLSDVAVAQATSRRGWSLLVIVAAFGIAVYDLTNPLRWRWHLVAVWFAVGVYLIAVGAHITAMLT